MPGLKRPPTPRAAKQRLGFGLAPGRQELGEQKASRSNVGIEDADRRGVVAVRSGSSVGGPAAARPPVPSVTFWPVQLQMDRRPHRFLRPPVARREEFFTSAE